MYYLVATYITLSAISFGYRLVGILFSIFLNVSCCWEFRSLVYCFEKNSVSVIPIHYI